MRMRWTQDDEQLLLSLLIDTHEISVKAERIKEAWPSNHPSMPTSRAISEHLIRVKAKHSKRLLGMKTRKYTRRTVTEKVSPPPPATLVSNGFSTTVAAEQNFPSASPITFPLPVTPKPSPNKPMYTPSSTKQNFCFKPPITFPMPPPTPETPPDCRLASTGQNPQYQLSSPINFPRDNLLDTITPAKDNSFGSFLGDFIKQEQVGPARKDSPAPLPTYQFDFLDPLEPKLSCENWF